jgi:hypothetical protein
MTLAELLPDIQSLPRGDKLHLIQLLAADVAKEEQLTAGWKNTTIEIWSPFDAEEAAKTLLQVLAADKASMK